MGGGRGSDKGWRRGLRQRGSQSRQGGRHGWRWVEVMRVDTGGSDAEWTWHRWRRLLIRPSSYDQIASAFLIVERKA